MPERPSALTMPEVTVWPRPKGLPIATTKSPTSARSESATGYLRQVRCLDLQDGHVRAWILAHDLGGERAVVEQRDGDLGGVLDHVRVGDDVAVLRIDDHARARALEAPLARHVRDVEEAAEERIVEQRVFLLHRAAGCDVHHRGCHVLQHRSERRHRCFADGARQLAKGDGGAASGVMRAAGQRGSSEASCDVLDSIETA